VHSDPPRGLAFSRFPGDDEIAWSRVLPGPILPLGPGSRSAVRGENRALAQALIDYHGRRDPEDVSALTRFLDEHPGSRYEASLEVNLGVLYKQQGRIGRAFPALARAWSLAKDGTDKTSLAVANWALGEAADMHAHLDPRTRGKLDAILDGIGPRDLHGPTTERVRMAFAGRVMREQHPDEAFRCGPVSLALLREFLGMPRDPAIERAPGSSQGFSLAGLEDLAKRHGMRMRAVRVAPGTPVPVPAIIHWRYDHYSAILERKEEGGREYFRIQNPLLDGDHWMSRGALEEEASGYYLVPEEQLQPEWQPVSKSEAGHVWGRCEFVNAALDQLMEAALKALGTCQTPGMPQYNFHLALASLNIADTPLGYTPPIGPPVQFRITYNQRDSLEPAIFTYSNLGPKWSFNWLGYIGGPSVSIPSLGSGSQSGRVYLRSGGVEQYGSPKSTAVPGLLTQDYGYHFQSHAHLVYSQPLQTSGNQQVPPPSYERQLPDGSKEIYGEKVQSGATSYFLTQIVDPQGNAIKFAYDSKMRITTVTDAIGQVTRLSYDLAGDPLKITKVTDPFGRSATLTYDFNGHLSQITDVMGMTSTFTYGAGDFITTMTTPYGETVFQTGHGSNDTTPDPSYLIHAARYPNAAADPMNVYVQATDPNGDTERVEYCNYASSLPQHDAWNDSLNTGKTEPIPYLNTRLTFYWNKNAWKQYPGDYTKAKAYRWLDGQILGNQSGVLDYMKNPLEGRVVFHYPDQKNPFYQVGSSAVPSAILRLLEDGLTQQTTSIESNDFGRITKYTDPAGRQTTFLYDFNGIDLLEARNSATNELLSKYTYSRPHQPATYIDASGQVTNYTYNTAGQILSVTDAKQQTTRYTYDAHGYLLQITGPLPTATTRFTYDLFGRVQTVTDSEGYTITYAYDALDRVTKVTHPDKTTEQVLYDKLDAVQVTDRLGRVTQTAYDALRRPVTITDPLGQTTTLGWCSCGALVSMTDPAGNTTTWNRDAQERITSKVLPDGSTTQYSYDPMTGRLNQVTDANGQTASYTYLQDGSLQQISYSNSVVTTFPLMFTYDANYRRMASFTDSMGTTSFTYGRAGSLGGLQLVSTTGARGETTTYSYDELGRPTIRSIDGVATTVAYDPLGRILSEINRLGRFAFGYVGATGRLQSTNLPNGQVTQYTYFDNLGDQRLKQIVNQAANKSTLSQFGYAYRTTGEISSFATSARNYQLTYDASSQLAGVAASDGGTFAYSYDAAGNRLTEAINSQVTNAAYNSGNQLTQTDAQQFNYDANGNLLGDGVRTFEWDAENRLSAINIGTHRSEFSYDGMDRRTRIVEKESGTVVNDKQLIWCPGSICEERDASTGINKRFFAEGETQVSGGAEATYYYTRDHLGSVREVTDASGAVVASYDYDPWGRTIKLSGNIDSAFGYAGYYAHAASGLYLTQYRAYDPNLGRWLSRDPIGESGGSNLYSYVGGNPMGSIDAAGLEETSKTEDPIEHTIELFKTVFELEEIWRNRSVVADWSNIGTKGVWARTIAAYVGYQTFKTVSKWSVPFFLKWNDPPARAGVPKVTPLWYQFPYPYSPTFTPEDRRHVYANLLKQRGQWPVGPPRTVQVWDPGDGIYVPMQVYDEPDPPYVCPNGGATPGLINWLSPGAQNSPLFQ
jgi:RHS repeat-associated protein